MNACKNWVIKIGCLKCCFYDFMMFFNMKIEWVLCELKQLKGKNWTDIWCIIQISRSFDRRNSEIGYYPSFMVDNFARKEKG
jgi:hypothetical protein